MQVFKRNYRYFLHHPTRAWVLKSVARRQVAMPGAMVLVCLAQIDADQIELAMTHAPFGHDLLGELPHGLRGTLEGGGLEALFVVEVHMHGSDREIVVFML